MEPKKSPTADLTRKSGIFFSIGLALSISCILIAFEWQSEITAVAANAHRKYDDPILSIDIPATDTPPAKPLSVKEVVVVDDIVPVDSATIIADLGAEHLDPFPEFVPAEVERGDDLPLLFAEEPATPRDGLDAFYKEIGKKIKYPAQARRMGIEGRVFVEFVVNRDGTLTDVRVIKGIGGGCDEEAKRIIESSPSWNSAKQRGKPVRQRYTLPIVFKLG